VIFKYVIDQDGLATLDNKPRKRQSHLFNTFSPDLIFMSEKFKVTVNTDHQFELTVEEAVELDAQQRGNGIHVIENHQTYNATVVHADFNTRKYTIIVNGVKHEVDIATQLDGLIDAMGLELTTGSVDNLIMAPMPGLILSVDVAEGDSVEAGQVLCVLEAMKMENALSAPSHGTVKSIQIEQGQTVEKNALLIELDLD
jgi:biotin carboxyl carrier protein